MPKKKPECSWGLLRTLSMWPKPQCDSPKYKVKVSPSSHMFAGETIYLCDYHFHNVALTFDSVEDL